jgi:hypothetical protein
MRPFGPLAMTALGACREEETATRSFASLAMSLSWSVSR